MVMEKEMTQGDENILQQTDNKEHESHVIFAAQFHLNTFNKKE